MGFLPAATASRCRSRSAGGGSATGTSVGEVDQIDEGRAAMCGPALTGGTEWCLLVGQLVAALRAGRLQLGLLMRLGLVERRLDLRLLLDGVEEPADVLERRDRAELAHPLGQ